MGTLTQDEARVMLERTRLIEIYFNAYPGLRQHYYEKALAWIEEQATQLPGPLDHAKAAIADVMWVAFLGSRRPIMTLIFRSTASGKETGELWIRANGTITAIIDDPDFGESNAVAEFRSNFPDQPEPGTQMQRAIAFMRCQGYERTGETRTWPKHEG